MICVGLLVVGLVLGFLCGVFAREIWDFLSS
jgi:hypothetical protein